MKPVLFFAAVVAALATAPALAQAPAPAPAPPPQANYLDLNGLAFTSPPRAVDRELQCFNGKYIVGANRSGEGVVYVQSRSGAIWRLHVAGRCEALDAAQKISLRAGGDDTICENDRAELVAHVQGAAGRCKIDDVRRLSGQEIATLATAPRR